MKKLKENNGFTLIELIVAIAILAFLMLAVTSLMTMNTVTQKKTKADMIVQSSAQETYSSLMDNIMQAKSIVIEGYTFSNEPTFEPFNIGAAFGESATPVTCVNKNVAQSSDTAFNSLKNVSNSGGIETTTYTNVYISKLTIEYAVQISSEYIPGCSKVGNTLTFTPTGGSEIKLDINDVDTCTVIYTFEKNNIYVTRTYKYMTKLNNTYSNDTEKANCLFSTSLNYVEASGGDYISGVVATIDADNNAMGIDLFFADKSMSYTSQGMVKVRNSYVIKDFN